MRYPTCILILGVVGVACALKVCPILRPKTVGLPEPAGLMCTITLESQWDTDNLQIDMAALSRLGIRYDQLLAVLAQQVMPWVVPWVAPPAGPVCVGNGCGVPPAVREYQVAAPSPLGLLPTSKSASASSKGAKPCQHRKATSSKGDGAAT